MDTATWFASFVGSQNAKSARILTIEWIWSIGQSIKCTDLLQTICRLSIVKLSRMFLGTMSKALSVAHFLFVTCQVSVMFFSRVIVKPLNAIYVSLLQTNENFKRNSSKIKRSTTNRTTNIYSCGSASHRYCVADCKTYKNKTKLRKWQMTSWVDVIRQTDVQNRIFHETS